MHRYLANNKTTIPGSTGIRNSPAANSVGNNMLPAASSAEVPNTFAAISTRASIVPAATKQYQRKGKEKETRRSSIEEILDSQAPAPSNQAGSSLQPILCHVNESGNFDALLLNSLSSEVPDSVSMAMSKGHTKSRTPSLGLLIPPSATMSEGPVESVEKSMTECPSMWKGIPRDIKVIMFDEPLHASVERFHHPYDPQRDDDPLLPYRAVDGILPGKTAEETILLRDASISEYVCGEAHMYGLEAPDLDEAAHIVLAIEQIFSALVQFVQDDRKAAFHLDPNFSFIQLLAWHHSAEEIHVTHAVLHKRTNVEVKHIQRYLNSNRALFTDSLKVDSISSYDSSLPQVRNAFGTNSTHLEIAKLAAQPEYTQEMSGSLNEAREDMVQQKNLMSSQLQAPSESSEHRTRTLRIKPATLVLSMTCYGEEESIGPVADQTPGIIPISVKTAGGRSGEKNLRFVSPTKEQNPPILSALLKHHLISALPGVGTVPEIIGAKATQMSGSPKSKETGGPSWTHFKEVAQ
ncbi:hypothetical protein DXG01_015775 [Tephrocybe rancida]|nr:hypothetical protein DXG01_015775 [Tephrocybe rancida]